jgi:predicted nucleic acid-binding protein
MIVVDTNLIAYLLIPGPFTALAKDAAGKESWCAPLLWRSEFRNVLAVYVREKGLPLDEARQLMNIAERLLWGREYTVRSAGILDCAGQSKRSAYDCEFVALAQDLGIRLLTTDESIINDFPKIALHLRDFV